MSVFVDIMRPTNHKLLSLYNVLCILMGSIFLSLLSQISIPLWFTPVPLTMQTLAILLIGATLGSKKGALAVLLYLAEGSLGLPVFAGAHGGIAYLFGPTGGYLFSFVMSAFVTGYLFERGWKNSLLKTMFAMCVGTGIILFIGACWLGVYVGFERALALGVYPYLVGDAFKILSSTLLITSVWKGYSLLK